MAEQSSSRAKKRVTNPPATLEPSPATISRHSSPSPQQPSSPFSAPSTPTPSSLSDFEHPRPASILSPTTGPTLSEDVAAERRKQKPHQVHIRNYFSDRPPPTWNFTDFNTHCRKFQGADGKQYMWTEDKIYSFWLAQLRSQLKDGSLSATIQRKVRGEIRRATSLHKNGTKREKLKSKDATATAPPSLTFVQGSVGTLVSGNNCKVNVDGVSANSSQSQVETSNSSQSQIGISDGEDSKIATTTTAAHNPSTPPPRDELDETILGTPPAPPPKCPSAITFQSGLPIDLWFGKLRNHLTSSHTPPPTLKFPYLLDSNILDLDDESVRSYTSRYPGTLDEISAQFAKTLPPIDPCVTYAIDRFLACAKTTGALGRGGITDAYRTLTETSPRPPGIPWSMENNAATYVNQAVGHLLTVMEKLSNSNIALAPYLREGFFDSSINPWFIDALFLGGRYSNLFLSRKEIQSYIPGCVEKFDAVVRYVDGIVAFDVGVVEVSGGAANVNNDVKSEKDFAKAHRALCGNLQILGKLVGGEWELMKRLQVVGIVNSGWNVTVLRMAWVTPQVMMLKTHRTVRIPLAVGQLGVVFPLMELLIKCQKSMEETVKVVLEYQANLPL